MSFAVDVSEPMVAAMRGAAAAPDDPRFGWTAAELAEHVREEHSTFTWLEPMLERAGFDIRDRSLSPMRTYAAYTCVRC